MSLAPTKNLLPPIILLLFLAFPKICASYSIGSTSSTRISVSASQASVIDQSRSKIYFGNKSPRFVYRYDILSGDLKMLNHDFGQDISKLAIHPSTGNILVSSRAGAFILNPATELIEHTFLDQRVDVLQYFPEIGAYIFENFSGYPLPRPNLYKVSETDLTDIQILNGEESGLTHYIRAIILRKFCPFLFVAGMQFDVQLVDHTQMKLSELIISSSVQEQIRYLIQGPRLLSIVVTRKYGIIEYIQDTDGNIINSINTGFGIDIKYLMLAPNSEIVLGNIWQDMKFFMFHLTTGEPLFVPFGTGNNKNEYFVVDWANLKLYLPSMGDVKIYEDFAVSCEAYGADLKTCVNCNSNCAKCFGEGGNKCTLCSGGKLLQDDKCVDSCKDGSFGKYGTENICYRDYSKDDTNSNPAPESTPDPKTEPKSEPTTPTVNPKKTEMDCKNKNLLLENEKCVEKCSPKFYQKENLCIEISSIVENNGLDYEKKIRRCSMRDCKNCRENYLKCKDSRDQDWTSKLKTAGQASQLTVMVTILLSTGLFPQIIQTLLNLIQMLQKFLFIQRDLGPAEPILFAFGEGGVAFDKLSNLIVRLTEDFKPSSLVERAGFSTLIYNNLGPIVLTTSPMILMVLISLCCHFWKKKKNKIETEKKYSKKNKKDNFDFNKDSREDEDDQIASKEFVLDEEIKIEKVNTIKINNLGKKRQSINKIKELNDSNGIITKKLKKNRKKLKNHFKGLMIEFKPAKLLEILSGLVFDLTMSCIIHIFSIPQEDDVKENYTISILSGYIVSFTILALLVVLFIFLWFSEASWLKKNRENAHGRDSELWGYITRRYFVLWMAREAAAAFLLFFLAKNYFWQVLIMSSIYLLPLFLLKINIMKNKKNNLNIKISELLQGLAFLVLIIPYKISNTLFLIMVGSLVIFPVFEILYATINLLRNFGKKISKKKKKKRWRIQVLIKVSRREN